MILVFCSKDISCVSIFYLFRLNCIYCRRKWYWTAARWVEGERPNKRILVQTDIKGIKVLNQVRS